METQSSPMSSQPLTTLLLIVLNVLNCQMEQAEIHVAKQNLLLAEVHNEKDFLIEQKLQWVYVQYMNILNNIIPSMFRYKT